MIDELVVDFKRDVAGDIVTGAGEVVRGHGLLEKGFEIVDDSFTGTASLQGSVGGTVFADINALGANAQGTVASYYHHFRVNCTVYTSGDSKQKIVGART